MKTELDTINRKMCKPEWTNYVYLLSFYKIQDIFCTEFVISRNISFIKEKELKNLFEDHKLFIINVQCHPISNPINLKIYFETSLSYNEINSILIDYFKNENKS